MHLAGQGSPARSERGYAMAALLVGLSVMAVLMGMALPVWSQMVKREKEEELIWRGSQYARAIGLFQRKYANAFPPTLDVLVEQKFLRKKYKDPITNEDFQLIPAGGGPTAPGQAGNPPPTTGGLGSGGGGQQQQPPQQQPGSFFQPAGPNATIPGAGNVNLGIAGVVSKSKDSSIKIYNGRQKYNEWTFVYLQTSRGIGPGGNPFANPINPGQMQPGRGGPFGNPNAPPGSFTPVGPGGRGMPPGGPPPGGRGFEGFSPNRPPVPFGQPPMQPGQQPPFGQPPFGQPFGGPGQPQPPRPGTRPPAN